MSSAALDPAASKLSGRSRSLTSGSAYSPNQSPVSIKWLSASKIVVVTVYPQSSTY